MFTRLGMPLEAARARLLLARALRGHGSAAAVAEARAALTAFEDLGAAADADEAAAFLRDLGVRAARRQATSPGAARAPALSRREQEVLALLSEGLSNRDIAGRLFPTRKTVEHHVRSLPAKLGVANRAGAAAYAARRQAGGR